MSEILLDENNKKILSILEFDARDTYNSIGKQVGISREVAKYRISHLEKQGVINGYYTLIDYSKLGLLFCRFFATTSSKLSNSFFQFVKK